MKKTSMLGAVAALTLFASPALAATLVTPDVGNNGTDGLMFDVLVGGGAVTFESLSVALWGDRRVDFEVYTRAGGIDGHTMDMSGWTLINTIGQSLSGTSVRTFDITDFTAAAGSMVGFYIKTLNRTYSGVSYYDVPGGAVGQTRASDGHISILSGYGKGRYGAYPGEGLVGSVTYTALPSAVPEPATWAMMIAGFGLAGASLRRLGRRRLSAA